MQQLAAVGPIPTYHANTVSLQLPVFASGYAVGST
jgi:hypothetical protein